MSKGTAQSEADKISSTGKMLINRRLIKRWYPKAIFTGGNRAV